MRYLYLITFICLAFWLNAQTAQPQLEKPFLNNEWNGGWDIAFYTQVSAYGVNSGDKYSTTPVRVGFNMFGQNSSQGAGLDLSIGYTNRFWSERNGHGITGQALSRAWLLKNWIGVGFGIETISMNIPRQDAKDGRTWEGLVRYLGEVKVTQYNFSLDLRWHFDATEETAGVEAGISYRLPLKGWKTE